MRRAFLFVSHLAHLLLEVGRRQAAPLLGVSHLPTCPAACLCVCAGRVRVVRACVRSRARTYLFF